MPLISLAAQLSTPTKQTMEQVKQSLDYCAMQEPVMLTYCKSDMVLVSHSDVGYLNKSNAWNRVGSHHFMSRDVHFPPTNDTVLNIVKIIKNVMSSVVEAKLSTLYINARKVVNMRWFCKKWDFLSSQLPCKWATWLWRESSMHKCDQSIQMPWTCSSIGFATVA